MSEKKCSNCFKTKPLSEFYVKRPSGHQSRCKSCNAEVCRGYALRAKERMLEGMRHV